MSSPCRLQRVTAVDVCVVDGLDVHVPRAVREAALAALSTRVQNEQVLDLVYDSFVDPPARAITGADRTLVYGGELVVRVALTYSPTGAYLVVDINPPLPVLLEVVTPAPQLHLVVNGVPPLAVTAPTRGPAALRIRGRDLPEGSPWWRTAWTVF